MGSRIVGRFALIALCGFTLLAASGPCALALDCIDYLGYIHRCASVSLSGAMLDVDFDGDLLYAVGTEGFFVLDRSDPAEPVQVAHLGSVPAQSLAIGPAAAYLVHANGQFYSVNLADPLSPHLQGELQLPQYCGSVAFGYGNAYVAAGATGLIEIDVSDSADPTVAAIHDTPYTALGVVLRDGLAFVADGHSLVTIDLATGARAAATPGGRPDAHLHSVAVWGDFAYLLDSTFGILVFDISDPFEPLYLADTYGAGYGELTVAGNLLFAGSSPGLRVFAIAFGGVLNEIGVVNGSGEFSRGIAVEGDYAYVTGEEGAVDVIDVVNPRNARPAGAVSAGGWPRHLDAEGDHAFIACGGAGLRIADVSDPFAPLLLPDNAILGYAEHVDVAGGVAYVATGSLGFEILDVSDPAAPFYLGGYITDGSTTGVDVEEGRAYVTGDAGLLVFDVSDPEHPRLVGKLATPGEAMQVAVDGSLAVVADGGWVHAVDVSDPEQPVLLGSAEVGAFGVALRDGLAYVVGQPGMQIFDVTDPEHLSSVGGLLLPGWPVSLSLLGRFAYVAGYGGGMQIVDVSDPAAPVPAGSAPEFARSACAAGDCLFVVDGWQLLVYPLPCDLTGLLPGGDWQPSTAPDRPVLTGHPNPFGRATSLRFRLPAASQTQVTVHDARGRLLRRLADLRLAEGEHSLLWDGRDDRGGALPAGVYWARVEARGSSEGIKLTLIR